MILLIDNAGPCLWKEIALARCRNDASRPKIPAFYEGVTVQSVAKDFCGYGFDHSSALSPFASGKSRSAASCKLRYKLSFSSWEELQTPKRDTHRDTSRCDFKRPQSMSSLQVAIGSIASQPPAPTILFEGTQHHALQFGTFRSLCALVKPFSGILSSSVMTHDHPSRSRMDITAIMSTGLWSDCRTSLDMLPRICNAQDSAHPVVGLVQRLAEIGNYNSFLVAWNGHQRMSIQTIPRYRPVNLDQGFPMTQGLASVKIFWDLGIRRPTFHTFPLRSGISQGDTSKFLCDLRMLPSPLTHAIENMDGGESKSGEQQAYDTCSSLATMLPQMDVENQQQKDAENQKQQPETWWDEDAVVLGGMLQQKDEDGNEQQQQRETWWDEDAVLLGGEGEHIYGGFEEWKPVSTLASKQSKSFFFVCKRAITTSFLPSSTQ